MHTEEDTPEENAAPTLKIPLWNPQTHAFSGDILEYMPGERLIYEHRKGMLEPMVSLFAAAFLGAIFGAFFADPFEGFGLTFLTASLILLVRWKMGFYLPIRWMFDLHEKELIRTRGEEELHFPLHQVSSVRLRHICTSVERKSYYTFGSYKSYNSKISLTGVPKIGELEIAQTGDFREDPEGSYYDGLAFANMLAVELHTPLEIEQEEN